MMLPNEYTSELVLTHMVEAFAVSENKKISGAAYRTAPRMMREVEDEVPWDSATIVDSPKSLRNAVPSSLSNIFD
jgi:hypothetical protein